MAQSGLGVHVVTTERTYKGKTYRTHLLRRSYREAGHVKKETLANITCLGDEIVQLIRQALQGQSLALAEEAFEVVSSWHHGHAQAVLEAMQRLGFERLLGARACREGRLVVMGLVAARILEPQSKLATARSWSDTTLAQQLGVEEVSESELYAALDWLGKRQSRIERRLADRHLAAGELVLYDLSSSYFEGRCCPLAAYGYSRDGKRGKLQVNYGVLANAAGCPVAVVSGDVGDPTTLLPQVQVVRERFDIDRVVLVGDRGMITQVQIDTLRTLAGLEWITALRSQGIRKLMREGEITPEHFEQQALFELLHPDFPGERLVACRNAELVRHRTEKRQALLQATQAELKKVQRMVKQERLQEAKHIGLRVGKVINHYKVGKHFDLDIQEERFDFQINESRVAEEAVLGGIYVVRTSVSPALMAAAEVVRSYKRLGQIERVFRSLKTQDLKVRPIFHRLEQRVRAHILLCLLAYYVQWHMMEAWRPLLFSDEELEAKASRDPVAPAKRSAAAQHKAASKHLADGSPVHSFRTLLQHLSTRVRNTCRSSNAGADSPTFTLDTLPDPIQRRAYELLKTIQV
jgi:transposase